MSKNKLNDLKENSFKKSSMTKETSVLIYSMINNILISVLKIIGGITFGLTSLFSDGMHTFSDFITDIMSMIGNKVANKKETKHHPFGFGRVEYLTNLYIGIILFALGGYIIYNSFGKEFVVPSLNIIYLLLLTIVLKWFCIVIMKGIAKENNNKILYTSAEESKADLYSTIGVAIIVVILQFTDVLPILKYADVIGTILIGLVVIKTGINIIASNSLALIGEIEDNKEINEKIKEVIGTHHEVKDEDIYLIKYGAYFKLQLNITLSERTSFKKIIKLEKSLKRSIRKNTNYQVRYVTIFVSDKLSNR